MTELPDRPAAVPHPPTFSLIVPVYNVACFLPAFLDSLTAQTANPDDCEVIFVNDGSTDESEDLLRDWMEQSAYPSKLISQSNQGLCAARNAGLAAELTGKWISFPDPDDVFDPQYLTLVSDFLDSQPVEPHLISTHVLLLDDGTKVATDSHPLRSKFRRGTRLVNMDHQPEYIHLQAASGFYRRETIEEQNLWFDSSIKPNFEDGVFTALYLSAAEKPMLGIVADAVYLYRRRADGGSLVQQSWVKEDKYSTVLERGYLSLLRQLKERRGFVPVWAQNTVLYDLLFYFRHEQSTHGMTGLVPREWTDRFHELVAEIFKYIDVETIDDFTVMPTSRLLKEALIIGYCHERVVPTTIRLLRVDAQQRIVHTRYFFGGELPKESIMDSGVSTEPVYAKIRDVTFFQRVLLQERILWLSATASLTMSLNGRRVPFEYGPQSEPIYTATPDRTWQRLTRHRRAPVTPGPPAIKVDSDPASASLRSRPRSIERRLKRLIAPRSRRVLRKMRQLRQRLLNRTSNPIKLASGPFTGLDPQKDQSIRRLAKKEGVRRLYGHAWTFIDRDTEAHDNAEHLYRFVLRHHPEVNAWFVLRRESADWDRLEREGFRLVPFGSAEHVLLLLNTDHLISSQVDHYIVRPLDGKRFGFKGWRFTFLQHGVTHNDLSRWINSKPISRFITASPAEHASISGDHTPYVFTDKEVRLTGFPRHDRLLQLREDVQRPDLILIMPTWRRSLMWEAQGGNTRRLRAPLSSTFFGRCWFDLIGSSELKAVADNAGLTIVFMPHPNMQAHFAAADLPSWVQVRTYGQNDVQELLARSAVTVTDYSSLAFEAAYIECPVVYYQFDRSEFFAGTHVFRRGVWDYETDGFGPVTVEHRDALTAIEMAVVRSEPDEPYLGRMRQTFPLRDHRCSERTFRSIIDLSRPASSDQD